MQPNNYSPYHQQQRFSPRDLRPRYVRSPYQNFSPHQYYQKYSPGSFRAGLNPASFNNSPTYHSNEESASSDSDVLDRNFIPLNLTGINSSSFNNPVPHTEYGYQSQKSRGSYNRKSWTPNSGKRWTSSPNEHGRQRTYQASTYSPQNRSPGFLDDIKIYMSPEFLKDPWEHLMPTKSADEVPSPSQDVPTHQVT